MSHGNKIIKSVLMTAGKAMVLWIGFILINEVALAAQVTASVTKHSSNGQKRIVSVAFENEPLGDVLHTLARKIKVGISYNTGLHLTGRYGWLLMHWEQRGALEAPTKEGAYFLGAGEDVGTLENDKLADLLILNSNPLDDIRNTLDIQYVMKDGKLYRG